MTEPTPQLRDDPVIVLGMHHSGTSILAEVLHRSGIFMQANMHHHESKFFTKKINDGLILGGGAGWAENPIRSVDAVMAKIEAVRDRITRKAHQKYVESGYDGKGRWGFKDPRTCVTLPLFLKIYPKAKLIHIIRDEKDVAVSLAASEKKGLGRERDLMFWRNLHRQYVDRARTFGQQHDAYLEFTYESFCFAPVDVVRDAFAFLEHPFPEETATFLRERIYTHRVGVGKAT